jgi:SAM-dependent methyltransferase
VTESGLLGDSPSRQYGGKLELFNRFAEPELRGLIGQLELRRGQRVLDAGCGVGLVTAWLAEQVAPAGVAIGTDLSLAHARASRQRTTSSGRPLDVVVGDLSALPLRTGTFDAVWCANTINHLRDPLAGVRALATLLRPNGRLALLQSAFLPDMFFAWDQRLEAEVTRANRQYYRDKYGLDERDVTSMRALLGLLRDAGLADASVTTVVIERASPLSEIDTVYFHDTVFNGYWGERVRPYLTAADWAELQQLCDPASPRYCLRRPDFHHLQTLTMVVARARQRLDSSRSRAIARV